MYPVPIDANTGQEVQPPPGIEWDATHGYFTVDGNVSWPDAPQCYKTQSDYESQINVQDITLRDARYILASG